MPALLTARRPVFVAMHMLGEPATMQTAPRYDDVVAEVADFFIQRAEALSAAGVDVDRMMVDPGLGFGKSVEHNLALLRAVRRLSPRWPILVGPSRKRFIAELTGQTEPASRVMGTAAVVAHCALSGVDLVRVHDVRAMREMVDVCARLRA